MERDCSRRANRLGLPFELELTGELELHGVSDGKGGLRTEQDTVQGSGRLQAGCRIDDVAGDHGLARHGCGMHDRLSRVHTYANVERAVVEPDACSELLDRSDNREPATYTPLCVSLARGRDTEDGHGSISDELLQRPSVPADRLAHCLEVRVLDDRDVLGVEPFRERREIREIAEEDGDDSALELAPQRLPRLVEPRHRPRRSSSFGSLRHFGRTLTTSSRNTGWPTSASTSGRARVPISRTIAPFLPTRMPFCDSVST